MLYAVRAGHDAGTYSSIVDQRSIRDRVLTIIDEYRRVDEVAEVVLVTAAELGYLADAAADRVLMAFAAGLCIVNRPKPFASIIDCVECGFISCERCRVGKPIAGESIIIGRGFSGPLTFNGSRERQRTHESRCENKKHP